MPSGYLTRATHVNTDEGQNFPTPERRRDAARFWNLDQLVSYKILLYRIDYSPAAVEHLRALGAGQQRAVLDPVDEQLRYQPGLETRNRKPMRPNPVAPRELRVGILRVYYEIEVAELVVRILAVGVRERDVVRIGGEVIKL